jgi:dihydroorotase
LTEADLVIKNVRLPDGSVADLSVTAGLVSHIGASGRAGRVVDGRGKLCLPAAIDMHVHMRDGPQKEKEDWRSGSMSALAGGVTIVVDQPNTTPAITTAERLAKRVELASASSLCDFGINGGVVEGADLEGMWASGAMALGETFVGPSSYGAEVPQDILLDAFDRIRALGALLTVHAEEVLPGTDSTLVTHNELRQGVGEARAVNWVSSAVKGYFRLHFCHLSCRKAIDAALGTYEVTPHHLFLSLEQFDPGDGRGKVNPPLRTERVRKGIWTRWDRIDVIASDHAPHTVQEKAADFGIAPSGIPGVETMVPLLLAKVYDGTITLESVIDKTTVNPARLLGIAPPALEVGGRADFCLYPAEAGVVREEELHSKAGWSPFNGMPAVFPELVVLRGEPVYDRDEFSGASGTWIPGRGYIGTAPNE